MVLKDMKWWFRQEFADQRGDGQADTDFSQSDVNYDQAYLDHMVSSPIGEPQGDYDVRSVYDSRPVNAYDFNFSGFATYTIGITPIGWEVQFTVPPGYRAIPKEWSVWYDRPAINPASASTVSVLQNGTNLPNNQNIIIGQGTTLPLKTFFICEEGTTFGMTGTQQSAGTPITTNVNVQVWGTLIPVSEVALPYTAANARIRASIMS